MGWTSWRSQICDRTSFRILLLVYARALCVDGAGLAIMGCRKCERHDAFWVHRRASCVDGAGNCVLVGFSSFCSLVVSFLWSFVFWLLC